MSDTGSNRAVRVRFAPSPTGRLHVGGVRTAIFNWLFAKKSNGTLVLRIEDTDIERSTSESERALLDDLRWLGLDWDEGPGKGGPHDPYRQSERLSLYEKAAEELLGKGAAYPCFCSDEELEKKRKAALEKGESPHYDGTCRNLTAGEVAARREAQSPEVIRFKVEFGVVRIPDLIRGNVELSTSMVGDFVLLRSNGLPTYNFAAAVDDHEMGITHVLRGEEHLPNTLRQVLIYGALGVEPPHFGHLPLILGEDRSKLSKRHGASSVDELRDSGYLSSAVVNYLVLLGWSHSEEREVLTVSELIDDFALERVGKSAAVFDKQKLLWMNGMHIRRQAPGELFPAADAFFPSGIKEAYSEAKRLEIFALLQERVERFSELEERSRAFLKPPPIDDEARTVLSSAKSQEVVRAVASALEGAEEALTPESFKSIMKRVGKETATRGKDLYFPVRAAITGSVHGPDIAKVAAFKGKAESVALLRRAVST
ncbi:MAG: glutamate--tRNA ligase [Candidatus Latescibacteria bacterium]|nr:glutamate--tRNA ligase [Candidatus Latescibacterota bacterium]NIM22568.1 glutamate--tRNA ligase [Candidatus Latescibacterota bacterium]NIM64857.1 glutamate--tRNA ligase [Candidatus Latescibacterota bacterium]NIO01372.1 glutamate--tRNA ligase [Candidatus Latescibacterota bacterium]NIO27882.1 glutamate--tRNA ligase [Candidatus Latescibacterota bacterium]